MTSSTLFEKRLNVQYKRSLYNGGLIAYICLYFQFIPQIVNMYGISKFDKFLCIYDLIIWQIWFNLFIKPFGWFFSTKINYKGFMEYRGVKSTIDFEDLTKVNIKKTLVVYFLRIIPIFFYKGSYLTLSDKDYLIENF